jgi:exonuclease 3'-5' domain-containing protein 1
MDPSPTHPLTNAPHILCDTDSKCEEALPALRSSQILILDCEGRALGTVGGALSIIILRTTTADPQTYLIDVKSLSTTTLNGVFDLLFSPKIQKIVFDGRKDFSALYHEFGIELYNVVDMQLVDIKSRDARGEKLEDQLKRLCGALAPREVWRKRGMYEQVHKLSSLGDCLREHQCVKSEDGGDLRPKGAKAFVSVLARPRLTLVTVDHQNWMERPLSREYLDYAASDARLIHALFDAFTTTGWTKLLSPEESMRYVTFHKHAQPKGGDEYKSHSLLPLGILNPPLRKCVGCQRELPFGAFAFAKADSGRQCFVCRAITTRMKDEPRSPVRGPRREGRSGSHC